MDDQVAPINWSLAEIADALAAGLARAAEADRAAQAVRGLDSLNEVQLHVVLESCLCGASVCVHREQRFPASRGRGRRSEGERCDFVLTPHGSPLVEEASLATLFAPARSTEPDAAMWIEVKTVAQYTEAGPNGAYASELQHPLRRDVTKLLRQEQITHAALLLVLFTSDAEVARHDLEVWQRRCEQRSLAVGPPYLRHVPIVDRLGNACCTIALFRVKGW